MTSIGRPPAAAISARSASVSSSTWASMPLTRAWVIRSRSGSAAPLVLSRLDGVGGDVVALGDLEEPLGGVGAAVEDDVLDALAQLGVDLVVDDERAGVDDAHVEARADGVEEEDGVDRLTDRVVAPEGERDVGDAAADLRAGEVLLDPAGGLDEVLAVGGVLLDAGGDGEDVGVEDDVLGREADLVDEDPVGPLADGLAPVEVVGLAVLVERHHDDGGAVLAAQPGVRAERLLALLHGDRVDDRLALHALEAGLDDLPLGGVDHHRHAADVGLGRDELEEAVHGRDPVDHPLVHVDVDDLCARLDLLRSHGEGGVVVAVLDQLAEAGGAGDVGALADVDEEAVLGDGQRLETGQSHHRLDGHGLATVLALDRAGDGGDVVGRGAAAPADEVEEAGVGELREDRGRLVGRLVVLAEGVGQAGVGVDADERVGEPRQLGDVGAHVAGAEGAVEADGQRAGVADRVPERLGDLARERATGRVGDRAGDDDRPAAPLLLEERLHGEDRRLGVEGVEDRLDHQQVGAAVDETACGDEVGVGELVERHVARARVVDVGRDGGRPGRRAEGAGDPARAVVRRGRVGGLAGEPGRLVVELVVELLEAVVGQRDRVGIERVGLDDVRAGGEVVLVDRPDQVGLRQREQVVVADEVARVVGEALTAVARLVGTVALDRRTHRTVQHHDPLAQDRRQGGGGIRAVLRLHWWWLLSGGGTASLGTSSDTRTGFPHGGTRRVGR